MEEGRWSMTPSGKSNPILASIVGGVVRIQVDGLTGHGFVTVRSFVPQGFAKSRRLLQSLSDNTSRELYFIINETSSIYNYLGSLSDLTGIHVSLESTDVSCNLLMIMNWVSNSFERSMFWMSVRKVKMRRRLLWV